MNVIITIGVSIGGVIAGYIYKTSEISDVVEQTTPSFQNLKINVCDEIKSFDKNNLNIINKTNTNKPNKYPSHMGSLIEKIKERRKNIEPNII